MKTIRNIIIATVVVIAGLMIVMFSSCKDDNQIDNGKITVRMTDAPAELTAVNVDITDVLVRYDDHSKGDDGWMMLNTKKGVYNLLDFQNGVTIDLASGDMPEGRIEGMLVKIGTNNTIGVDGTIIPVEIEPGFESTVYLRLNNSLTAENDMVITIDFDAEKSVKLQEFESFTLQPYITVQSVVYTD